MQPIDKTRAKLLTIREGERLSTTTFSKYGIRGAIGITAESGEEALKRHTDYPIDFRWKAVCEYYYEGGERILEFWPYRPLGETYYILPITEEGLLYSCRDDELFEEFLLVVR